MGSSATRYAVLLRGINVGGHRRIAMADLRDALEQARFTDVATYVTSGNVALTTRLRAQDVAHSVERIIAEQLSVETDAIVRTHAELADLAATNPFMDEAAGNPSWVHVMFFQDAPTDGDFDDIDAAAYLPERFVYHGAELYVWYPNGSGRSRLSSRLSRLPKHLIGTSRNWRTVERMIEMTRM